MRGDILDDKVRRLSIRLNNQKRRYERIKGRITSPRDIKLIQNLFERGSNLLITAKEDGENAVRLLQSVLSDLDQALGHYMEKAFPGVAEKIERKVASRWVIPLANETKQMIYESLERLDSLMQKLLKSPYKLQQKPYLEGEIKHLRLRYQDILSSLDNPTEENIYSLRAQKLGLDNKLKRIRDEVSDLLGKKLRRFFGGDILQYDIVLFVAMVILTLLIIWLFVGDDSPMSAKENAMAGGVFRLLLSQ